jgi:hypothetical protein
MRSPWASTQWTYIALVIDKAIAKHIGDVLYFAGGMKVGFKQKANGYLPLGSDSFPACSLHAAKFFPLFERTLHFLSL